MRDKSLIAKRQEEGQMKTQTETKPAHTPTPWKHVYERILDSKGMPVSLYHEDPDGRTPSGEALEQIRANAAYIVRAVNAHEELLEAAKDALEGLACYSPTQWARPYVPEPQRIEKLKQAIAKAEGR
jgi:hypothetical protein